MYWQRRQRLHQRRVRVLEPNHRSVQTRSIYPFRRVECPDGELEARLDDAERERVASEVADPLSRCVLLAQELFIYQLIVSEFYFQK